VKHGYSHKLQQSFSYLQAKLITAINKNEHEIIQKVKKNGKNDVRKELA